MVRRRHPQPRDVVTVVLLAVVALAVLGELTVWIPVAGALARTYGRTAASATGWVFGITMALAVLVTGPLADRYGRRPVLLVGLVALATASLAAGAAPSWPVHLGARAAQGLAAATFPPVVLAWVAEALPAARSALAVTVVVTAMQAATPIGQLYGQWVTAVSGWRVTYLSLATAYLLFAAALRRRLTDTPVVVRAERPRQTAGRLLGILDVRPLRACWLLSALLPGAVVAMYAGLQLHLPDVSTAPTDVLMAARIAGLAGILVAPLLLRTFLAGLSPRGQALVGIGVAAAGLLGQVLVPSPRALVAGSMLVGIGLPVTMAPVASLIAQFAAAARASAFAVQSTVIYLGVAAGGAMAGLLGYAALCLTAAAALAVGVLPLVLTVPTSAEASASHGAWAARPHRWAWAASIVGATVLVVLLGIGGRDGCWLGCNRQGEVAQTRAGSTEASAGTGGTLGVRGGSTSGSSRAVGTDGGPGASTIPTTIGVAIGSETTVADTPLTLPPATGKSGIGTPPATTAPLGSARPPLPTSRVPSTTAPPTTAEPSSTTPPTTAPPSSTTMPTSTTTMPSSTAPPTSDSTPPSSATQRGPR
jgi:MFS transporter, YNFM family, putative membrane transport protein